MSVSRYPIDFEALEKGDVIPPEVVESFYNCKRTDYDFGLKLLSFGGLIERQCGFNIRTERFQIIVLTDSECGPYLRKRQVHADRSYDRIAEQYRRVDVENLNDRERLEHQRDMLNHGRKRAALARERRVIQMEARQKEIAGDLPLIDGGTEEDPGGVSDVG